ncbi:hypothetical protein HYX14_00675 [Candidatus Woesearchaeota archaeon]|nr:hypothetical protein [Candidatus Woesearchaeota archaeon]
MVHPQFIEEKPMCLADVREALAKIEKRDTELNFLSKKTKEYLESFEIISHSKREGLHQNLRDLGLTRLKEEHMAKILDFLPKNVDELRVVLTAYPLSLPRKEQESIVEAVAKP